jgi:hypothetical protein
MAMVRNIIGIFFKRHTNVRRIFRVDQQNGFRAAVSPDSVAAR